MQKCTGYNTDELQGVFNSLIPPCLDIANLHSAKVLIKPNLITGRMGKLACTDSRFIYEAAKWFVDKGALVTVGDSPAFGTARSVLDQIGAAEKLKSLPVSISNFAESRSVKISGSVNARVAVDAMETDILVNLPKVKAHAQMLVSLAVKNYFGCVIGMHKPLWHMRYGGCGGNFAGHLVDLLPVMQSGISLIDGIAAMHETGPIHGRPFPLEVIGCSANPVALDRALLEIIRVKPELSPLMKVCRQRGIVGADIEQLIFPVCNPREMAVSGFVVPGELHPIRFNPFRFIRGNIKRIFHKIR